MTEATQAHGGAMVSICTATTLMGMPCRGRVLSGVSAVHCPRHLDAAEHAPYPTSGEPSGSRGRPCVRSGRRRRWPKAEMMDQVIHERLAKGYDRASALIRVGTTLAGFGYDLKVEELRHRHQCEALAVAASEYLVLKGARRLLRLRAVPPGLPPVRDHDGGHNNFSGDYWDDEERPGHSLPRFRARGASPGVPPSRPTRPPDPRCRRRHLPARGASLHKGQRALLSEPVRLTVASPLDRGNHPEGGGNHGHS